MRIIRRCRKSNKYGFTLIEVVLTFSMFALLSGAATAFYYYQARINNTINNESLGVLSANHAIYHMFNNIQKSAWVNVTIPQNLTLYSHSSPYFNTYTFGTGGNLSYTRYSSASSTTEVLARNIEGSFTGAGTVRPNDRYAGVKVILQKMDGAMGSTTEDTFYNEVDIYTEESWNVIYVDPANNSGLAHGTRQNPLLALSAGLSMAAPEASPNDCIYVLSNPAGAVSHQLGTTTISGIYVYFKSSATFSIISGATVTLNKGTIVYLE